MMKRSNKLFLLLLLIAPIFFGCDRDMESEGISRIINYPKFDLTGGPYMSIVVGSAYSEPGIKVTEGGAAIPFETDGTVDPNTVGIYEVVYSAKNSEGYEGTATRTVAVLPNAENPGVDISGKYSNVGGSSANGSNALVSTVTKLAPGFYLSSNVWGGTSLAVIAAYIVTTDGTTLTLPLSAISPYGRVQGTGTLSPTGLMSLSVSLLDQGIANSPKSWQRQQ
jgi:hypothetical protein